MEIGEETETNALAQNRCKVPHIFQLHREKGEIISIRKKLLAWYNTNKRILPWRTIADSKDKIDDDIRGYSVWVSEIMLQQTQVTTVMGNHVRHLIVY